MLKKTSEKKKKYHITAMETVGRRPPIVVL